MLEVWEAIQYNASTGCQWRLLLKGFTAVSTVLYYFYKMRDYGAFTNINELLSVTKRLVCKREADPTAAVLSIENSPIIKIVRRPRIWDSS